MPFKSKCVNCVIYFHYNVMLRVERSVSLTKSTNNTYFETIHQEYGE